MTRSSPSRSSGRTGLVVLGVFLLLVLGGGGCVVSRYNGIVAGEEKVDSAFSEIDNQYKRRNDLIPQLVATIQGSADFEEGVLTQVTEARASVGRFQLPADPGSDPAAQAEYLKMQQGLGSALSRLMVVAEAYPDLKTTSGFRDLQVQVEGTENRIAVARRDYIDRIQEYNTSLRKFPGNIVGSLFGLEKRVQLEAAAPSEREVPSIDFGGE